MENDLISIHVKIFFFNYDGLPYHQSDDWPFFRFVICIIFMFISYGEPFIQK